MLRQVTRSADRSYTEMLHCRLCPEVTKHQQLVAQADDGTLYAIDSKCDFEEAKRLSLRFFISGESLGDLF